MVGHFLSSAAHRAAAAASMGALHSMRARVASSPTRPWWFRIEVQERPHEPMMIDVFLDGLHDFVGAWAVGAGHFPHGGA
eukprot:3584372-Prymnesium_polylepis.1